MRSNGGGESLAMEIDDADALARLEASTAEDLDRETFGVVRLDAGGRVVAYNACESARAGLSSGRVIGRLFFTDVAPCMNNHLVGDRFREEPELDVALDYLLTLRMKPAPVRLRLLKSASATFTYILIMDRLRV